MTILYTYVASAAQYPGNLIHIGQHLTICVKCPLHAVRVELGVVDDVQPIWLSCRRPLAFAILLHVTTILTEP